MLSGWEGKPRVEADEERWQRRLAELKAYRPRLTGPGSKGTGPAASTVVVFATPLAPLI